MANARTTIDETRSTPPRTIAIRQATARDECLVPGLCRLLRDAIDDGASIGFLAPLGESTGLRFWRGVFADLDRDTLLWVAQSGQQIVGTVQLALCHKENGRHRAEVQKLLVLRTHRGNGIATRLMQAAEQYAHRNNRRLLYLDTIAGSAAETVYQHLGWSKSGEIPDYAAMPNGEIRATAIYFKKV